MTEEVDRLVDLALAGVGVGNTKVNTVKEIENACPTNFNLRSECFAAISFNEVDTARQVLVSFGDRHMSEDLIEELHLARRLWTSPGRRS